MWRSNNECSEFYQSKLDSEWSKVWLSSYWLEFWYSDKLKLTYGWFECILSAVNELIRFYNIIQSDSVYPKNTTEITCTSLKTKKSN